MGIRKLIGIFEDEQKLEFLFKSFFFCQIPDTRCDRSQRPDRGPDWSIVILIRKICLGEMPNTSKRTQEDSRGLRVLNSYIKRIQRVQWIKRTEFKDSRGLNRRKWRVQWIKRTEFKDSRGLNRRRWRYTDRVNRESSG